MAEENGMSDALNFTIDWQEFTGTNEFNKLVESVGHTKATGRAILKVLEKYPDAVVKNDITFLDGSRAILTTKGFIIP